MSRLVQSSWLVLQRAVSDSYQILRATYQQRDLKAALLQEQSQNDMAGRLLRAEKQWSLLRYHGLLPYLRQTETWNRYLGTTVDSSNAPRAAKVAFMITSKMRTQLTDTLGYSADQVRSLTPTQANILIENEIKPSDFDLKVIKQLEVEARKVQQAELEASSVSDQEQPQEPTAGAVSFMALEEATRSAEAEKPTVKWFEVMEKRPDHEASVVGLYRSQAEAEEAVQVREALSSTKKSGATFWAQETQR